MLREHVALCTVFPKTFTEVVLDQLVLAFRGGRTSYQPGDWVVLVVSAPC